MCVCVHMLCIKHNLLSRFNMVLHVLTNFRYQISTFATKLGVRNIAFLGSGILLMNYIVSVLAAVYMPQVNINLHHVPSMKFFIHS